MEKNTIVVYYNGNRVVVGTCKKTVYMQASAYKQQFKLEPLKFAAKTPMGVDLTQELQRLLQRGNLATK